MSVRAGLRQITPPIVASAWRTARRRGSRRPADWEYLGGDWVDDPGAGWNATGVVSAYRRKLPEFRRAIAAPSCIGVSTEAAIGTGVSAYHQNVALEYAYALARASARDRHVSVLDWGGGFGFMSFIIAELFPDLVVDFHVKDVPLVVAAARVEVPGVTFWEDHRCLDREFDLITASSSLQYEADWAATLGRLAAKTSFLLVNRFPITPEGASFVTRQHAYGTSYIGWIVNRDELLAAAHHAGLHLERELTEGWSAEIPGSPRPNEHRGYLFRRDR